MNIFLRSVFLSLGLFAAAALTAGPVPAGKPAHYPDWWFERDVIPRINPTVTDPTWPGDYAVADDYAAANLGQLKNISAKASEELSSYFPGSEKLGAIKVKVEGWRFGGDDYSAANQGQLKAVSDLYYDLLEHEGFLGGPLKLGQTRPWTEGNTDDDSFALINLGQLKWVYSFDLSRQFFRDELQVIIDPMLGGTVGLPFSAVAQVSGTPASVTYSGQNLPAGLSINAGTGAITGIPQRIGAFPVLIKASAGGRSGEKIVTITVVAGAPVITSPLAVTAAKGRSFLYIARADYGPATFTVSSLPSGLSFDQTDATISGVFDLAGTYEFTLTASNSNGSSARSITVTVGNAPPVLQPPFEATAIKGEAINIALSATDSPIWNVPSGLPSGVNFDAGTGRLRGSPTEAGTFHINVSASNSAGVGAGLFVLTVSELSAPFLADAPRLYATQGQSFTYQQIPPPPGTAASFSAVGLPSGLTINSTTGLISGIPAVVGASTARLTATNAAGSATIDLPFVVLSPNRGVSTYIDFQAGATPWPSYESYSAGLITSTATPSSDNTVIPPSAVGASSASESQRVALGFPLRDLPPDALVSSATLRIHGSASSSAFQPVTLHSVDSPAITDWSGITWASGATWGLSDLGSATPTSTAAGYLEYGTNATLVAKVGSALAASGRTLPLLLRSTSAEGLLTPARPNQLVFSSHDAFDVTTRPRLRVNYSTGAPPVIFSGPAIIIQAGASANLPTYAIHAPVSFSASGLPPGLSISPSSGLVSGTPTALGDYTVTLQATNANGVGTVAQLVRVIAPPPVINSPATWSFASGSSVSYTITATNTPTSFSASGLPSGLTLDTSTGAITGTVSAPGSWDVTLTAANEAGAGTLSLALTVQAIVPIITSSLSANTRVGDSFYYSIVATQAPTSYTAAPLPSGLTLSGSTISGTPTSEGVFTIPIAASNGVGSASANLIITVGPALVPQLKPFSAEFTIGQSGSATLSFEPVNPDSVAVLGLPAGLSLSGRTITGTPTGPGGSYVLTVTATRAAGGTTVSSSGSGSIYIRPAGPWIQSSPSSREILINEAASVFSTIYLATGTTSISLTGLPAGLTFAFTAGQTYGRIQGICYLPGTYSLTATVGDGTTTNTVPITLTVRALPVFWADLEPSATVGRPFGWTFATAPTADALELAVGPLPAGWTFDSTKRSLIGIPAHTGLITIPISAKSQVGTRSGSLRVHVEPEPSNLWAEFQSGVSPSADYEAPQVGIRFNTAAPETASESLSDESQYVVGRMSATEVRRILLSFDLSSLPDDIEVTAAELYLHPEAWEGDFSSSELGVYAASAALDSVPRDWANANGYRSAPLASRVISTSLLTEPVRFLSAGTAMTVAAQAAALDGGPLDLVIAAPALESATSVGVFGLAGTASPAASAPRLRLAYRLLEPTEPPVILPPLSVEASAGQSFAYQIAATHRPTAYSATGLPAGLSVNTATGAISGTPAAAGEYRVQLTASNAIGTATAELLLRVQANVAGATLEIVSGNAQTGLIGELLPSPVVVRVRKAGAPMAGALVVFDIPSAEQLLRDSSGGTAVYRQSVGVLTDAQGLAAATLRLPFSPGRVEFQARILGGSTLDLYANGTTQVAGPGQSNSILLRLVGSDGYMAEAIDAWGVPQVGRNLTATLVSGSGSITPSSGTTDARGRMTFSASSGGSPGAISVFQLTDTLSGARLRFSVITPSAIGAADAGGVRTTNLDAPIPLPFFLISISASPAIATSAPLTYDRVRAEIKLSGGTTAVQADSFIVERRHTGEIWSEVGRAGATPFGQTLLTDSGLVAGRTYEYRAWGLKDGRKTPPAYAYYTTPLVDKMEYAYSTSHGSKGQSRFADQSYSGYYYGYYGSYYGYYGYGYGYYGYGYYGRRAYYQSDANYVSDLQDAPYGVIRELSDDGTLYSGPYRHAAGFRQIPMEGSPPRFYRMLHTSGTLNRPYQQDSWSTAFSLRPTPGIRTFPAGSIGMLGFTATASGSCSTDFTYPYGGYAIRSILSPSGKWYGTKSSTSGTYPYNNYYAYHPLPEVSNAQAASADTRDAGYGYSGRGLVRLSDEYTTGQLVTDLESALPPYSPWRDTEFNFDDIAAASAGQATLTPNSSLRIPFVGFPNYLSGTASFWGGQTPYEYILSRFEGLPYPDTFSGAKAGNINSIPAARGAVAIRHISRDECNYLLRVLKYRLRFQSTVPSDYKWHEVFYPLAMWDDAKYPNAYAARNLIAIHATRSFKTTSQPGASPVYEIDPRQRGTPGLYYVVPASKLKVFPSLFSYLNQSTPASAEAKEAGVATTSALTNAAYFGLSSTIIPGSTISFSWTNSDSFKVFVYTTNSSTPLELASGASFTDEQYGQQKLYRFAVVARPNARPGASTTVTMTVSHRGAVIDRSTAKFIYPDNRDFSFPVDEASGSRYRKIALNGIPLSDGKPQQSAESDQEPEETYFDALSLGLRHSTTDVYLPVPGSDLALSARRDLSPEIWTERSGLRPQEDPTKAFGISWTTNLVPSVRISEPVSNTQPSEPAKAFVTDESGGVHSFYITYDNYTTRGVLTFVPMPTARNQQPPTEVSLALDRSTKPATLVFKRKFGTTIRYELSSLELITPDDRIDGSTTGRKESFARARTVQDRLGHIIDYAYESPNNLVPSTISVRGQPGRRLSIRQNEQGLITSVWDALGRETRYRYEARDYTSRANVGDVWTLTEVEAPDGGITRYSYEIVQETDLTPMPPETPVTPIWHCEVASITDPRGNTHSFEYALDHTKRAYKDDREGGYPGATGYYTQTGLPRQLARVGLPSGAACAIRNESQVWMAKNETTGELEAQGLRRHRITDTTGFARTYTFGDAEVIPVPQIRITYPDTKNFRDPVLLVYKTMEIEHGKHGKELFEFWPDAGMALVKTTDFSGKVTQFKYTDEWEGSATTTFRSALKDGATAFRYHGDVNKQIDARNKEKIFTYTPGTRLLKTIIDEEGRYTEYTFDNLGRRTHEHVYSSSAKTTLVRHVESVYGDSKFPGFVTRSIVHPTGNASDPAWAAGLQLITDYKPDSAGNIAEQIVDPSGLRLVTRHTYDANGNRRSTTDPRGNTTRFGYDTRNRLQSVTHPDGTGRQILYDLRGNKVLESDENGQATGFVYDFLNRLVTQVRDMNGNLAFTAASQSLSGVDENGDLFTHYAYNAANARTKVTDPRGFSTSFAYDDLQRLASTTDAKGGVTRYEYEKSKNPGAGVFASSGFKPTRTTDPRGYVTSVTYDELYRPVLTSVQYSLSPSASASTSTEYDDVGNPTAVVDPLGKRVETDYDELNRPTVVRYPTGYGFSQTFYTSQGFVWKTRDPEGRETTSDYDAAGRVTFVRSPLVDRGDGAQASAVTQTIYDGAGNAVAVIDPRGKRTDYAYDPRNRRIMELRPAVYDYLSNATKRPVLSFAYDGVGRVTLATDPKGSATHTLYDAAGRATHVVSAAAPMMLANGSTSTLHTVTRTVYDAGGLPLSAHRGGLASPATLLAAADPHAVALVETTRVALNTYDSLGRLLTTQDALGLVVTNEYDAVGNRTAVTDAKQQRTRFSYDGLNRLVSTTDPANRAVTLEYNGVNKTARVDSASRRTEYRYDDRHRLKQTLYIGRSQDDRAYDYDRVGNLKSVVETGKVGKADVAYTYDALNRVETERSGGILHRYRYDLAGNRLRVVYDDGGAAPRTLDSTYDDLNRLRTMTEGGRVTTTDYDLNGNVARLTQPNNDVRLRTYDALNRTEDILTRTGGVTQLSKYTQSYDLAGNVRRVVETYNAGALSGRTIINGYDAINRLLTEAITTGASTVTTTYTYDDAHNRTGRTISGGPSAGSVTYGYNNLNQLVSATTGETYGYDLNGNRTSLTKAGQTDIYVYDYENRLVQLQKNVPGADVVTGAYAYVYDYRTRRVERSEVGVATKIVFSGGTSVREYTVPPPSGPPVVEYVRGSDYGGGVGGIVYTLRGGTPSFTHYNARGDVVAKVDALGALTWQAAYEAFGKRTQESGSTADRQKANTKDEDPTGLLNEGFRYRDLATGTFITRDPLGFVDGPNMYAYVVQNPWSKFDPEGLAIEDITKRRDELEEEVGGPDEATIRGRKAAREAFDNGVAIADTALGFSPMGPVMAANEVVSGEDLGGNKLSWWQRGLSFVGLIPGGKIASKADDVGETAAKIAFKNAEDVGIGHGGGIIPRNTQLPLLNQGAKPTCGANATGMVLDTVAATRNTTVLGGLTGTATRVVKLTELATTLNANGVKAAYTRGINIDKLAAATAGKNPAIVAIRTAGGIGHAVVVDGITIRNGHKVVAIRDPHGAAYFQTVSEFEKIWIGGQSILLK